jgi:hypothetical protein
MHTHECENCHKPYEHEAVVVSEYGTPCTEIRNGFCSPRCEDAYPKRGATVHAVGCPCGFCKAGFTSFGM